MIIYIYGSDSFKKDIRDLLDHSNIKFRLGDKGHVVELNTTEELKEAIEDEPNNIYLIDDSKIIKNNSLNQKIKFLKPKDGIEQEYLFDHGIGDISVDTMEELATHIKNKLDSEVKDDDSVDIHDSIVGIVEDAYDGDDEEEYVQLDDELSQLLHRADENDSEDDTSSSVQVEQIDDISSLLEKDGKNDEKSEQKEKNNEITQDKNSSKSKLDVKEEDLEEVTEDEPIDLELELKHLLVDEGKEVEPVEKVEEEDEDVDPEFYEDLINSLSFEEDFGNINNTEPQKNDSEEVIEEEVEKEEDTTVSVDTMSNQGEVMSGEFSEFDTLNEADLLAALNGGDDSAASTQNKEEKVEESKSSSSDITLNSSSSEDIAKLITQLLNNKTLEITIKVKD